MAGGDTDTGLKKINELEPDQPIELLRAFDVVDTTAEFADEVKASSSESEIKSREQISKRRPPMNFGEMGIPAGTFQNPRYALSGRSRR